MSFFTKGAEMRSPADLEPFTIERVTKLLEELEINFDIDDDGDAYAVWDNFMMNFMQMGEKHEIFAMRGNWRVTPSPEKFLELVSFCNEWNSKHIWPKTYAFDRGEIVSVHGELVVDYEHGLSTEQLKQHLICGLNTIAQFMNALNEKYPEEWQETLAEAERRRAEEAEEE